MSNTVIKVENLGKQYRIGAREGYKTFRETLVDAAKAPFHRLSSAFGSVTNKTNQTNSTNQTNHIWALRDVSFEVKQGEVVGIIGRNGAGKSTLLKILAQITEPTEGRVELRGRVGSLLEVGTGFHPELTGHENVYLYGAILGMDRWEVTRKFDEIVAFAEIERFIDTPVKRYSSGMYMRLAFAVAAHLEPEILLVDEVLAVGDAQFQKKCLGKMEDVARGGRTVLFVSHNMGAIRRLCEPVLLLEQGWISVSGKASETIERYLQDSVSGALCWQRSSVPTGDAYLQRVFLCDHLGGEIEYVTTASETGVAVDFFVERNFNDLQLSVGLLDFNGDIIFGSRPQDAGLSQPNAAGQYHAIMYFPPEILMPKMYGISVALWQPQGGVIDRTDSLRFSIHEVGSWADITGGRTGVLLLRCKWTLKRPNN